MDPLAEVRRCTTLEQLDALEELLIRLGHYEPHMQRAIVRRRRILEHPKPQGSDMDHDNRR
jgi:hypothetical protein